MSQRELPEVKISYLDAHLHAVTKLRDPFHNPDGLKEAQTYVVDVFQSLGYQTLKDTFDFSGKTYENWLMRGAENASSKRFIIGAHIDAVPGTPGADDNASGVAGMLEVARLLSETGLQGHVDFALFNLEEYGMVGSSHYAQKLNKSGVKISGMVSLEMIGYISGEKGSQRIPFFLRPFYPDTGNFIALVGDGSSKALLKTARQAFKAVKNLPVEVLSLPAKGMLIPETRLSDHSPFWDAGYPALLITDTSFFRNPHYHSESDRIETLDLDFMARVTEGVARLAIAFA